jgi:anti-anti-sigma factor
MAIRQLSSDALGEPAFRIVRPSPTSADAALVRASGELDRDTAGLLLAALDRLWRPGLARVIDLDLGELTFIDAAGARCLLDCRTIAAGHGMMLTVRNLQPTVRRVLEVLGILEILDAGSGPRH